MVAPEDHQGRNPGHGPISAGESVVNRVEPNMTNPNDRRHSFGEKHQNTFLDNFGIWLSWRQIRYFVPDFSALRVGDFGSGYEAALTRFLLPRLHSAVIVDISLNPELRDHPKITAIEGTLPRALDALSDETLDVIICNSVLEHLWEPLDTLRHFRRLLAPGGFCLVNVPSWRGKFFLEFATFHLGLSPAAEIDDHKMYFDPRDLWPLLVRAGFKPSRINCFRHKFGLNTFAACQKERS